MTKHMIREDNAAGGKTAATDKSVRLMHHHAYACMFLISRPAALCSLIGTGVGGHQ
jgi:hypothetical protein